RIEYAELGLNLRAVGRGTSIQYVQVMRSRRDGVAVDGGTVDLAHLFLTGNAERGLSWSGGWQGRGQFIVVLQDAHDHRGAIDGTAAPGDPALVPAGYPRLYNLTLIAPRHPWQFEPTSVMRFSGGTGGELRNLVVLHADTVLDIDDAATCANVN